MKLLRVLPKAFQGIESAQLCGVKQLRDAGARESNPVRVRHAPRFVKSGRTNRCAFECTQNTNCTSCISLCADQKRQFVSEVHSWGPGVEPGARQIGAHKSVCI